MKHRMVLFLGALLFVACGGGDDGGVDTGDVGPDAVVRDDSGLEDSGDVAADVATPDAGADTEDADTAEDVAPDVPFEPDAAFVHAVPTPPSVVVDAPYTVDAADLFLGPFDARSITVIDGVAWIGTDEGLMRYDDLDGLVAAGQAGLADPVLDVARDLRDGRVVVVFADRVVGVDPDLEDDPEVWMTGSGLTAAATDGTNLWVGSSAGLWMPSAEVGVVVPGTETDAIRDVAVRDGVVFVATARGLGVAAGGIQFLTAADGALPDDDVRGLGVEPVSGRVFAATATGLAEFAPSLDVTRHLPGKGGLPASDLTAVLPADGTILTGHVRGASVVHGAFETFEHYVSRRHLPDDAVRDVAFGADGSRWFATAAGVSRIALGQDTLDAKASNMFAFLDEHFWRMDGFVAEEAVVDDPVAQTTWTLEDFDNDGLWTQMAIGAFCQAYAVTGDERYYQAARKAMDAMFLLIDVPAADFEAAGLGRGFITRSLVRDDEGAVFDEKASSSRWHRTTYGDHDYYWKDDTSSDETAGHFYGFPLFYDLCAKDDAERAAVADHAGALAGYILDGGFALRDLDGEPTTFGHWEPESKAIAVDGFEACVDDGYSFEDCAGAAFGGGWLNGLEILGHMLAAWHMTGEKRFYDAYESLIRDHGYDRLVAFSDDVLTVTNPSIANHSDHELAMLAYHTLIRYEPRDDRRQQWIDSLLGMYAWEVPERQPLWTAYVALAVAGQARVEDGVRTLREMPMDLRDWRVDTSHRKDATRQAADRFGDPQWDTVFPYDEIRTMWWNGNPYAMVDGGNGRVVVSPTAYLLAHWTSRFAGILGAESATP